MSEQPAAAHLCRDTFPFFKANFSGMEAYAQERGVEEASTLPPTVLLPRQYLCRYMPPGPVVTPCSVQ